jgi:hypothetical protein
VPLTPFQSEVAALLSENRTPDSHLAGGSALHFEPNSKRTSDDLDYFHDSEERVASAFHDDQALLVSNGYTVDTLISQPGYIRAVVSRNGSSTKGEWSHNSAWRFMPPIKKEGCGYVLHPVDFALNKLLALAGRNEPRDLIDVLHAHREILPLGALCWAAAGKDPGFTPRSLLELLRRRGSIRPEDLHRLRLTDKTTPEELKREWLRILEEAETFVKSRPPSEIGCLYYSDAESTFVAPAEGSTEYRPHHGKPGGVLPGLIG